MEQKISRKKLLFSLFATFFKIGAFTFGGGYAMIPLIQREAAEKKKWISDDDILEIVAIAESTPGPIAINSATFIGYKTAGVWGSTMATLGVVLPSFIVISVIAYVLTAFQDMQGVTYAFNGIRAGVLALLVKAVCGMYKKCPKGAVSYVIMALAFVAVAFFEADVLAVIVASALIGLCAFFIMKRRESK